MQYLPIQSQYVLHHSGQSRVQRLGTLRAAGDQERLFPWLQPKCAPRPGGIGGRRRVGNGPRHGHAQDCGVGQLGLAERGYHTPRESRTEPVRKARNRIGFVDHERSPGEPGSNIAGRRGITAKSGNQLGPVAHNQPDNLAHRNGETRPEHQRTKAQFSRQRKPLGSRQRESGRRNQTGFQAPSGADHDDLGGVAATLTHKLIRHSKQGVHVAGGASARQKNSSHRVPALRRAR